MQSVTTAVHDEVFVEEYTGGLVGPGVGIAGTVKDGGRIRCVVPPGCWGPMITPAFRGGHEVTRPVAVAGAQIGDAIAITIEEMHVRSLATASGTMITRTAAFGDDPFVDKKCPSCGTAWPETRIEGTGPESVRCANCGASATAFAFEEGYTIVFDDGRQVGLTMNGETAHDFALRAAEVAALPAQARQHPILLFEPHTIPGTLSRLRPFIGNIGTTPSADLPDSHNAGDFGHSLVGAHHPYAMTQEQLNRVKTDGHLDTNEVRPGAVLICPVKVDGGGIYIGDCHANQGDGELGLHTTDITADASVRVDVIKHLQLDGPILLPVAEDLPHIARPYTERELEIGEQLAQRYHVTLQRNVAPVQFIGTGPTLNEATDNAIDRAAGVLEMTRAEVRNRCTITGAVEIGRLPGVVQLTMLAPLARLDAIGLGPVVRRQYGL
ncbi:MAG TPA: acetamidase/formamidase family protein [Ktedonobacterales bacterium]